MGFTDLSDAFSVKRSRQILWTCLLIFIFSIFAFGGEDVQPIDEDSAKLLRGSTLDYHDALAGAGFQIVNPNAARTCGCGSSFEPTRPL